MALCPQKALGCRQKTLLYSKWVECSIGLCYTCVKEPKEINMKKWIALCLVLLMILPLAACSKSEERQKQLAWEEQYNLGIRYLSEGNYEEARLAFEASIEIDPKQENAYLGIAEAYIALGQPEIAQAILEKGLLWADDTSRIQSLLDEIIATYLSFNLEDFDVSGTCGEAAYWGFHEETGELVIWGSGEMENYKNASGPWSDLGIISATVYGVTTIGVDAFSWCKSLTEIAISNSVTTIGASAFCWCDNLTEITIPDSVTSIGEWAFIGCNNLKTADIGSGVTSLGSEVFGGCDSLTHIKANTPAYSDVDGVLFTKDMKTLLRYPESKAQTSYTIPDGVIFIEDGAFKWCNNLAEIIIPDSVTSVGKDAFYSCNNLQKVNIPNGVTSIADFTFFGCGSLEEITIPSSVTSIGNRAFLDCDSLTEITIPDGVTTIGEWAFSSCSHLTSVTIPNSVTSIGAGAFRASERLTDIFVDNTAYCNVNGVLFTKDMKTLLQYPNGKTQTSYSIPSGVTVISREAFVNCTNLKEITIPNTVTTIKDNAFVDCRNLTTVSMGNSVSVIEHTAFYGCSNLTNVYYSGTKAQWNAIKIDGENDQLLNSVHCNN